jgi:hypothetical protein
MLNTEANIAAPDDFYAALIDMHRGLTPEQSALVNARLILLLANHIGDAAVLREAMAAAKEEKGSGAGGPSGVEGRSPSL